MFPALQILMANFVFYAKTVLKMSAIFSRIAPVLEIILNLSGQTEAKKIIACNSSDGTQISHFIISLDNKNYIAIGRFSSPFDGVTITMINRFISSAVGKIHRLRREMLRELEAP